MANDEELDTFIEDGEAVAVVLAALGPHLGLSRPERGSEGRLDNFEINLERRKTALKEKK